MEASHRHRSHRSHRSHRATATATATAATVCCMFVLLTAETPGARAECPLETASARAAAEEGLTAAFQDAGFDVARGAMWFFKHSDLDEDCEDCFYANPSSTYGCPLLVRDCFGVALTFAFLPLCQKTAKNLTTRCALTVLFPRRRSP